MKEIRIRLASTADVPAMCGLLAQLGYAETPEVIGARLAALLAAGSCVLVAQSGTELVGLAALDRVRHLHRQPDGRLTGLVVAEALRGKGVGKRLLAAAEAVFREWGCARAELSSGARRSDAHRFYLREDYVESPKRFVKPLG